MVSFMEVMITKRKINMPATCITLQIYLQDLKWIEAWLKDECSKMPKTLSTVCLLVASFYQYNMHFNAITFPLCVQFYREPPIQQQFSVCWKNRALLRQQQSVQPKEAEPPLMFECCLLGYIII